MKRDIGSINWQDAFPPMPEECRAALMKTARSVEEEKKMKRFSVRTIVIAAIMMLTTAAVALAATTFGLGDWLDTFRIQLPKAAQEMLANTEKQTVTVGPISFTIQEAMADGRLGYLTTSVSANGAILVPSSGDPHDAIGSGLVNKLKRPDITRDMSYAEAAQKLGWQMYMVGAYLELEDTSAQAFGMGDGMYLDDGSMLLVDMIYMDGMYPGVWKADAALYVTGIDPKTCEAIPGQRWTSRHALELTASGVLEQRTYAAEGKLYGCLNVTSVKAELTCAGAYITVCAEPDEGMDPQRMYDISRVEILDLEGQKLPKGISFSREVLDENDMDLGLRDSEKLSSEVRCRIMVSVDELPESITLTDGETTIIAK